MSKAFEFELGQRVAVPTGDGVQGIVIWASGELEREPHYRVRWLDQGAIAEDEIFDESVLREANPSGQQLEAKRKEEFDAAVAAAVQKICTRVDTSRGAVAPGKPGKIVARKRR